MKHTLTCRTTRGAPSSFNVVDLNGLETRTKFLPLSLLQCCTILWKNCSPVISGLSNGRKLNCSKGRWSRCTVAIWTGLQSFGSAPKLLEALFSLPWGEATGDEGCSETTEGAIPFELFLGVREVEDLFFGWLFEIPVEVGSVCWVSSSAFSCSTSTSSIEDSLDADDWRVGSTRGTSLISQRGYFLWNVTSSLKFSLVMTSLFDSVDKILEKWLYKSLS